MGICEHYVRLPLVPASDATSKKIAQFVKGA
jgi:dihydrodipicolinate synthase/N-acetylneuraminate lyase